MAKCAIIPLLLLLLPLRLSIFFIGNVPGGTNGLKCIQGMRGVDSTSGREIDGEFHEVECADHFCAAIRCRVSEGGATAMAKGCRNGTHECSLPERLLPVAWQSDPGKYCECTVCQGDLCNSAQGNVWHGGNHLMVTMVMMVGCGIGILVGSGGDGMLTMMAMMMMMIFGG